MKYIQNDFLCISFTKQDEKISFIADEVSTVTLM